MPHPVERIGGAVAIALGHDCTADGAIGHRPAQPPIGKELQRVERDAPPVFLSNRQCAAVRIRFGAIMAALQKALRPILSRPPPSQPRLSSPVTSGRSGVRPLGIPVTAEGTRASGTSKTGTSSPSADGTPASPPASGTATDGAGVVAVVGTFTNRGLACPAACERRHGEDRQKGCTPRLAKSHHRALHSFTSPDRPHRAKRALGQFYDPGGIFRLFGLSY